MDDEKPPASLPVDWTNQTQNYQGFRSLTLPNCKTLMSGAIDTTTNFIERPIAVAQRTINQVEVVGDNRDWLHLTTAASPHLSVRTIRSQTIWSQTVRSLRKSIRKNCLQETHSEWRVVNLYNEPAPWQARLSVQDQYCLVTVKSLMVKLPAPWNTSGPNRMFA